MKSFNPYLMFNGNCRQAMDFYKKCLGGQLDVTTFGEAQGAQCASENKDHVIHARLFQAPLEIMASDTMPNDRVQAGNNFSLTIDCETTEEQDRLFQALSENGKVTAPLHDAFWGARFGMLTDQFGISWMFNMKKAEPAPGAAAA